MQGPQFLSVADAHALLRAHTPVLPPESVALADAAGRVLAGTLRSPLDLPPFDDSAMDGYALAWQEDGLDRYWPVVGEIAAGHWPEATLPPGTCRRIFTGAPIPPGADTVVQQEWVHYQDGQIRITGGQPRRGDHIRRQATHIAKGDPALSAGHVLHPGALGFLAGMGLDTVNVYRRPRVSLLITGSELASPGTPLQPGQIYESNGQTLRAALGLLGVTPVHQRRVSDALPALRAAVEDCLPDSDLILFSGGISVGDHDVVRQYLEQVQAECIFYKVRQRPGKPLFFGRHRQTLLFALPGNPASVLHCFYQYVWPTIRRMGGHPHPDLPLREATLTHPFTKKAGLTFFLKGHIQGEEATPLEGQLSYIMRSFAEANALIILEEGREHYAAGERVMVQLLPH